MNYFLLKFGTPSHWCGMVVQGPVHIT